MKLKKREIGYFVVLLILTLLCKQTIIDAIASKLGLYVHFDAGYLKLSGVLLNFTIGYVGLIKHEVKWLKIAWLTVYGILLLVIATGKATEYSFNYSLIDFDYSLFVSPVFYLVGCMLPRYVIMEHINLDHLKAK